MRPRRHTAVAITLGDPAGIGPQVALAAALASRSARSRSASAARSAAGARLLLIGDLETARAVARRLGRRVRLAACEPGEAALRLASPAAPDELLVVEPALGRARVTRPGHPTIAGARLAYESIRTAVELAQSGVVDAICTAPISKEWFDRAGVARTGHTEILAELTGARGVRLMMALDDLRVVLATSHIALRDVPRALTVAGVAETIAVAARHLTRWWAIARPVVAVAALNPHASDGGIYGDEETRILVPAIRRARRAGIDVLGPVPADTLFSALGPRCDAVVAMYHDQGLIPVKQADVHRAVNVTLGLPFVRTSPDHGTAFDIAGSGRADPRSMQAALALAIDLVARRRGGSQPSTSARRARPVPARARSSPALRGDTKR